jgi:hypothetical protein
LTATIFTVFRQVGKQFLDVPSGATKKGSAWFQCILADRIRRHTPPLALQSILIADKVAGFKNQPGYEDMLINTSRCLNDQTCFSRRRVFLPESFLNIMGIILHRAVCSDSSSSVTTLDLCLWCCHRCANLASSRDHALSKSGEHFYFRTGGRSSPCLVHLRHTGVPRYACSRNTETSSS